MLGTVTPTAQHEAINSAIEQLLGQLGQGQVDSVAYDTAWVARLAPLFPGKGFDEALPWLLRNQHEDGSWGAEVLYHHDRFICTLVAVISLRCLGQDERAIRRAEEYLWRNYTQLLHDPIETIGFSVLAISLIEEARILGLDIPTTPLCDAVTIERKLQILRDTPNLWRKHTMSFSMESIRACFPHQADFLEANGSIGTSPAATDSFLLRSPLVESAAIDYLKSTMQPDGGAPNVAPIDTFEAAWALNYLRVAGAISPEQPGVKRVLDWLWKVWSAEHGMGFSSFYSLPNLDDTAVSFAVLRWGGYPVNADVFGTYEEADHFRCFPGEIDPSLSAHLRMLSALQLVPEYPEYEPWLVKTLVMLEKRNANGTFRFDKWHASPYYLSCIAVQTLCDIADSLIVSHIRWLEATQHDDGGWGYYGWSTPEETAYALLALLHRNNCSDTVDASAINAAGEYLYQHINDDKFTSLWIGKCLYTPANVVRAVVLAALNKYSQWRGV